MNSDYNKKKASSKNAKNTRYERDSEDYDDESRDNDTSTKLIKVISEAGIASRRKCEKFILNGRVRVNNTVILEPSYIVNDGDEVSFDRQIIEREKKHYIALYKPMGVVSTTKKLPGQRIITEFFKDIKERLFYAGRLDSESRGIMIITNDGEFANIITHPSYEILKVYDVTVTSRIDSEKLLEASFGVTVKGVKYSPFKFTVLSKGRMQSKIRITINEGKNREIRKIFEYLGYKVKDLERISVGIVGKFHKDYGTLTLGQTRRLTEEEIAFFFEQKKNVGKKFIDVDDILDDGENENDLDSIFSATDSSKDNNTLRVERREKREPRKKKQNRAKWAKAKPKDIKRFKNKKPFNSPKKTEFLEDRKEKRSKRDSGDFKSSKKSGKKSFGKFSNNRDSSRYSSDIKDSKPSSRYSSDIKDSKPSIRFSSDRKDSKPSSRFSSDRKDSKPSSRYSSDRKDSKPSSRFSSDRKDSKPSSRYSSDRKDSKPSSRFSSDRKDSKPSSRYSSDRKDSRTNSKFNSNRRGKPNTGDKN